MSKMGYSNHQPFGAQRLHQKKLVQMSKSRKVFLSLHLSPQHEGPICHCPQEPEIRTPIVIFAKDRCKSNKGHAMIHLSYTVSKDKRGVVSVRGFLWPSN